VCAYKVGELLDRMSVPCASRCWKMTGSDVTRLTLMNRLPSSLSMVCAVVDARMQVKSHPCKKVDVVSTIWRAGRTGR